ncbi:hypothetical protein CDV36_016224 [Fusarium kuroshium]|uniref:Uncharacterized protein n=1 Tax=Fusarium kuroshium TaxID=2010991 RepID=A0A3M2QX93_9HYPO|nr:hypothetical protein CDV36_016224 [Fusarium kuroshium]
MSASRLIHRAGTRSANRANLDNQIATYLDIYSDSYVGTIVVAESHDWLEDKKIHIFIETLQVTRGLSRYGESWFGSSGRLEACGIREDDPLRPRRQTSSIPETPSPILILTFNIAFDTSIFPGERHHISLAGCYQLLCYTGARPAELVDGERKKPKDGTVEELFGHKVVQSSFSEDGDDPVR